ncbi:HAMP domain-containing sensor histidine kinase [Acinetobacter sp. MD2]|uniref:sensor histidine kinase n=1 Tax=Acinetobacter sp. MD2 TaxID=2600066 RepID=UPI002D1F6FFC|nr:HAMP domain-containing sensor histidine kinase [Acinetobacter sp. MD2]MEB3768083.1 HAMP domain-containing histidine kinase [Acinetobacter sp. MD2]
MLSQFGQLKKHIILRFFIVTLCFSGMISLGFVLLSKQHEHRLQSIDMGLAIERIRHQYLKGEDVGRVNRFFHGQKFSSQFPDWLRKLPTGFHKVTRDHLIWHVMVVDYPDQRYILLRDYTNFEEQKRSPWLFSGFILTASGLLSLILLYITNYYIIQPIEKLEKNIRKDLNPNKKNQLAPDFPHNEIGQLAQAFDEVYDQLNHALQRERLFTADVSHELRTPLMVILTSCELLQATSLHLPEKSQQRLATIQQSAQRILQQLQIYLALARQDRTSIALTEQQSLTEIATHVIQENKAFAERYQVHLSLDQNNTSSQRYPADLCATIMSNLVRNAIEYAGSNCRILIQLHAHGFSVSDNGLGIAPELQPQLFEAFTGSYQSAQHLGLGLSLVQRICHYLNWEIEFYSSAEQGTHFFIHTQSKQS